jgi:hypothetical protein
LKHADTTLRFRWAALQVDELIQLRLATHLTIEQSLKKLPKDLYETYTGILLKIDQVLHRQAINILRWLIFASRRLFIEELLEASAVDLDSDALLDDDIDRLQYRDILDLFPGLITVQPALPDDPQPIADNVHVVTLAHFTVQEFLLSEYILETGAAPFQIKPEDSHDNLGKTCLAYLYHFNSVSTRECPYTLRQYAWYRWEKHIFPDWSTLNERVRRKASLLYQQLSFRFSLFYSVDSIIRQTFQIISIMSQDLDINRLRDALNIPYFIPDFESFGYIPHEYDAPTQLPIYQPLPEQQAMRLVRVLPSLDEETVVRCSLVVTTLDSAPPFTALSYTWGGLQHAFAILLTGSKLTVTGNLNWILRRLRMQHDSEPILLWIDAICINREDMAECTRQVRMMPSVYESAQEVVVSLGEGQEEDQLAIQSLVRLAAALTDIKTTDQASSKEKLLSAMRRSELSRILSLFHRPWYSRSWFIQDIVVAPTVTLMYGTLSLKFRLVEDIMLSATVIDLLPSLTSEDLLTSILHAPEWRHVQALCRAREDYRQGTRQPLLYLMSQFLHCQCTDPRDKIFSMHNISADAGTLPEPDYSISISETYIHTSASMLQHSQRLDLLSFPRTRGPIPRTPTPSWVPDFALSTQQRITPLIPDIFKGGQLANIFRAFPRRSSTDEARIHLVGNVVVLKAVFIDHVVNCFELPWGMSTPLEGSGGTRETVNEEAILRDRSVTKIADTLHHTRSAVGESTSIEASWRILLADQWPPGCRLPTTTFANAIIPPTTLEEERSLLEQRGLMLLTEFWPSRALFTTKQGNLGLGPMYAQPDDLIVLLEGGPVPYVVRQNDGHLSDEYEFVGEWCVFSDASFQQSSAVLAVGTDLVVVIYLVLWTEKS